MFDFWKADLTEEETERLVDRAAEELKKRRLEAPAILMLESHRPLANVGSQAAIVFGPFLIPFLGFDFVNDYARLFTKQENVERLLRKLEEERTKTGADTASVEEEAQHAS